MIQVLALATWTNERTHLMAVPRQREGKVPAGESACSCDEAFHGTHPEQYPFRGLFRLVAAVQGAATCPGASG
jgi:hypothetical protein